MSIASMVIPLASAAPGRLTRRPSHSSVASSPPNDPAETPRAMRLNLVVAPATKVPLRSNTHRRSICRTWSGTCSHESSAINSTTWWTTPSSFGRILSLNFPCREHGYLTFHGRPPFRWVHRAGLPAGEGLPKHPAVTQPRLMWLAAGRTWLRRPAARFLSRIMHYLQLFP